MNKILLMTAALVLSASAAFAADAPAKADLNAAPAAPTISQGERAWGKVMDACLQKRDSSCYVVEHGGHLVGFCPVHKDSNAALFKSCSDEANASVAPKRWSAN